MSVLDRIMEIQAERTKSQRSFETSIDKSSGYLNQLKKNDSMPSLDVILKIIDVYPDYNLEWLATGKGAKTKNNAFDAYDAPEDILHEDQETVYEKKDDELMQIMEKFVVRLIERETKGKFDKLNRDVVMLLKRQMREKMKEEGKKTG